MSIHGKRRMDDKKIVYLKNTNLMLKLKYLYAWILKNKMKAKFKYRFGCVFAW